MTSRRRVKNVRRRMPPAVPEQAPTTEADWDTLVRAVLWDPDSGEPNPLDSLPPSDPREVPTAGEVDAALAHLLVLLDEPPTAE